jgi:hypothetical protein
MGITGISKSTLLNARTKNSAFLYLPNATLLLDQCLAKFHGALCTWVPLNLTAKVFTLRKQRQISRTPVGLFTQCPGRDSKHSCPVQKHKELPLRPACPVDLITEPSVSGGIDPRRTIIFVHYSKMKCLFPNFLSYIRT